jgi:hypothetical protein
MIYKALHRKHKPWKNGGEVWKVSSSYSTSDTCCVTVKQRKHQNKEIMLGTSVHNKYK